MMNKDLMDVGSENSDDGNSDPEPEPLLELMDGKDNESEGHSSEDDKKMAFVNPLAAKVVSKKNKVDGQISEGEWSDESEGNGKKKGKGADKKVLGKRKRGDAAEGSDEDAAKDFFGGDAIEVVPANDPGAMERQKTGYESMDSDDMAETRILAKKMLRKKQRTEILDATYNRYSFHEAPESLPSWFVEDEGKHYYRRYNATKDEIAAEKEEIKAYNTRPSKKVEEAKARKKKRLVKAMQKIKTKA
jgi:AdoMet-dependent rRNA methyltransferase SPB1